MTRSQTLALLLALHGLTIVVSGSPYLWSTPSFLVAVMLVMWDRDS